MPWSERKLSRLTIATAGNYCSPEGLNSGWDVRYMTCYIVGRFVVVYGFEMPMPNPLVYT